MSAAGPPAPADASAGAPGAASRAAAAEASITRDYRWNFAVNILDGGSFWFGASFISSAVILPLFVRHFTDSALLIGLVSFINVAGPLLPQLFVANAVERAPRKKFFPVTIGFFLERVPILLLAPVTWLCATQRPLLALGLFFCLYAWHCFGAGVIVVGWQDMIAKIIPVQKRGRFFGMQNFLGNGTGILGALALPFVLGRFDFPVGYVISFGAAAGLILLSWFFLAMTREPAVHTSKPAVSQLAYLRSLPGVLRRDPNFLRYLLAQVVFALGGMATGFLVVYAVRTWNLPDAQASGFTIALQVGLAAANLCFGLLADRSGHKLILEICFGLSVLALVLAVLSPGPWWFLAIFFLRGAASGGSAVSATSIVYEFTDAESRPTYIGLSNTVPGVASAVAPLIGGWLASAVSYRAMFVVAVLVGTASWALLRFGVKEPRRVSPGPR